ncbi:MAG: diguanylate cyclase [Rhodanobacteraceae bacterium]
MIRVLGRLDRHLARLGRVALLALTVCCVLIVGGMDYFTGYEVSLSVFYLMPVALAAWYAGRWTGIAIALLSCLSWFIADLASGHLYSNSLIPVWNMLVRFAFFVITALLLTILRKSLRSQQHLARTDSLTGLYGRRAFDERLEHDLALAHRKKEPLTLAYVDVDDFKSVNDTHGHSGGDQVLQTIGRVLKGLLRDTDTAARLGGDEFALVLPDTDSRGAQQIIEKFVQELRETLAEGNWRVTCSVGVVTVVDPTVSIQRAIAAADQTMFRVKRGDKGAIEYSLLGEAVQTGAAADARVPSASPAP